MIAYFGNYLVVSVIFKWGNSFVDPRGRAGFAATKEMISLLSGMIVSLAIGYAVDGYTARGNVEGGFLFIAAMMLLMNAGDFICLLLMKSPAKTDEAKRSSSLGNTLRLLFSNKSFVCVVILHSLINISTYMTLGFMGIYKTRDLAFTVGAAQLINIAGCLARFALTKPIAHYTDRRSYAKGVRLGLYIAVAGYLVCMFASPDCRYLIVLYTVLYNASCAGTGQNLNNIVYSYVDIDYFVEASAIKNSVAGLCGFGASVLGGVILRAVQENGNSVLGLPMRGQQLLALISLAVTIITLLFTARIMEKQTVIAK
jgi:Na+/melibiose symporter-like transporter